MQTALIGIADVHAGPLPDRFKAFEFIDLSGIVFLGRVDASKGAPTRQISQGKSSSVFGIEDGRATTDKYGSGKTRRHNKYLG
jgi:hypothetical protein